MRMRRIARQKVCAITPTALVLISIMTQPPASRSSIDLRRAFYPFNARKLPPGSLARPS